jgi:hypothetical protein
MISFSPSTTKPSITLSRLGCRTNPVLEIESLARFALHREDILGLISYYSSLWQREVGRDFIRASFGCGYAALYN